MAFEELPFEEPTMTPEEMELAKLNFNNWIAVCNNYINNPQ